MRPLPLVLAALLAAFLYGVPALGQCEEHKLFANDGEFIDYFGFDVAADGDLLAVGAPQHDSTAFRAGAIYVYRHGAGGWAFEQKLVGTGLGVLDFFGRRIDLEGEWLVAGAFRTDGQHPASGVVYVFRYDSISGSWLETQKLVAPDGFSGQFFGQDVSLSGDRILVGAAMSGYVFRFDSGSGTWLFEQKLVPAANHWAFGRAVALDGDVGVIGSAGDHNGFIYHHGAAHVFERDPGNGTWAEEMVLIAHDGHWSRAFGWAVAVAGDVIAVSAWDSEIPAVDGGAVYLHRRNTGSGPRWAFFQRLGSPLDYSQSRYGFSVDLGTDALLVGADHESAAYLYELDPASGQFGLERRLDGFDLPTLAYLGAGVSLSERWATVGGYRDDGLGVNTGAAYAYDRATCGPIGDPFCDPALPNSSGVPGRIQAAGVDQAGGQPLLLIGSFLPPGQLAMLLASLDQASVQPPGSQGVLCLGGNIGRFAQQVTITTPQGTAAIEVDTNDVPTPPPSVVLPGETWSFQLWFRDVNPTPTSNFTHGVEVTFL